MENQTTDLRVIRTRQSIRKAICDMVVEMDYPDITVKELTRRAMINRNTFYLHYSSIDALWEEICNEIADKLISMYASYDNIDDFKVMIRSFFEYVASGESTLLERILCCDSYHVLAKQINYRVINHRKEMRRGVTGLSEAAEEIILSYSGSVAAVLIRRWIADGKKLPVEELTELATKLICHGMESVIGQ